MKLGQDASTVTIAVLNVDVNIIVHDLQVYKFNYLGMIILLFFIFSFCN
jgi:hypothetical protein